jgi:GrpB-like predicted nucleotidyltransferase (UPF0157 family)
MARPSVRDPSDLPPGQSRGLSCDHREVSDAPVGPEFVRPRVRHDAPIQLAEYDPAWRDRYAELALSIHDALGPTAVVIAHVGSTSVPGLPAKPIIDVLVLVDDPTDESSYVSQLEQAGFVLHIREPAWHEHRLFRYASPAANVHVFAAASVEAERMLLFRDRLRSDADERALYADTKRELAARTWTYVQDYANAKSAVVEAIITRAREADRGTPKASAPE